MDFMEMSLQKVKNYAGWGLDDMIMPAQECS